ncbi:MAG: hypothetical protein ACREHG_04265 [Candidatus Saccharimonadales bacterium]
MTTTTTAIKAHKTLVGIGLMFLVLFVLVEIAGTSHNAAVVVELLLFGALLIQGMTHSTKLLSFTQSQPYNPLKG